MVYQPAIFLLLFIYFGQMWSETQEILEYEYDINLQNYSPGIYYAKFYYQKDKYTRETNHTLKFIKAN